MVRFSCPKCAQIYQASDDKMGLRTKCQKCGTRFRLPKTTPPPLPADVRFEVVDDEDEVRAWEEAKISDRARRRRRPWVVVLLVFGVVLVASVVFVRLVVVPEINRQIKENAEPVAEGGYYDPDDLRRYFVGRPEVTALEFFGNPIQNYGIGPLNAWVFLCPTRNRTSGRKDTLVIVLCERRVVKSLHCGDAEDKTTVPPPEPKAATQAPAPEPAKPSGPTIPGMPGASGRPGFAPAPSKNGKINPFVPAK